MRILSEIKDYDIVLLTETHFGYNSKINIENFKYYPICRSKSSNARFYGGLGILIKNNLPPGVNILMNTNTDYQWLKLDKHFFLIFQRISFYVWLLLYHLTQVTQYSQTMTY